MGDNIPIEAFLDRKTMFDIISKDGNTSERRLQIYIYISHIKVIILKRRSRPIYRVYWDKRTRRTNRLKEF